MNKKYTDAGIAFALTLLAALLALAIYDCAGGFDESEEAA